MNQPRIAPLSPPSLNVAAIRQRTLYAGTRHPYTQENFARAIGVPVGTLRQWEQRRREPTGAARVLLMLIQNAPEAMSDLLDWPKPEPRIKIRVGSL